jgi:hypothetical protein
MIVLVATFTCLLLKGGVNKMAQRMLADCLVTNKPAILKKWFNEITDAYLPETARVLKHTKEQFANPMGHTFYQGIEGIYDELLGDMNQDRLTACLDDIVRIKAVQEFTPAQAIAFIFTLKKLVRGELEPEVRKLKVEDQHLIHQELSAFDARIDFLALLSFDIYIRCREKIYQLRINEIKRNLPTTGIAIKRG